MVQQVKVYSTPNCPWCKRTKKFLDENSIPYQGFDVASDKAARDEMVSSSKQLSVPVVDIDGDILVGFDEEWLRQKLNLPQEEKKVEANKEPVNRCTSGMCGQVDEMKQVLAALRVSKYKCAVCGYVYDPDLGDPDSGIKPGTLFDDIPDDWVCPVCGSAKREFDRIEEV